MAYKEGQGSVEVGQREDRLPNVFAREARCFLRDVDDVLRGRRMELFCLAAYYTIVQMIQQSSGLRVPSFAQGALVGGSIDWEAGVLLGAPVGGTRVCGCGSVEPGDGGSLVGRAPAAAGLRAQGAAVLIPGFGEAAGWVGQGALVAPSDGGGARAKVWFNDEELGSCFIG